MASDIYPQDVFHPDRHRAEGYAWGFMDSEWLSILGSHWERIPLPESPGAAQGRAGGPPMTWTCPDCDTVNAAPACIVCNRTRP